MIPKLSARAWEILLVIDERCHHRTDDGPFFMPNGCGRGTDDWCDQLGYYVNIGGAGDAKIIQSLRAKGLIRKITSSSRMVNEYESRITEDGRLAIERGREEGKIPLRFKD